MPTRFVVYLEPSAIQLDSLDGSLSGPLENKIEKFVTKTFVRSIFKKQLQSHLRQIEQRNDGMRAFCTWWKGDVREVLLIFAIYKKAHQDEYLARQYQFNKKSKHYHRKLDGFGDREFDEWLRNVRNDPERRLVGP